MSGWVPQRCEEEERERKHLEKLRLKEEEKMKEEVDLYERGLSARYWSTTSRSSVEDWVRHVFVNPSSINTFAWHHSVELFSSSSHALLPHLAHVQYSWLP